MEVANSMCWFPRGPTLFISFPYYHFVELSKPREPLSVNKDSLAVLRKGNEGQDSELPQQALLTWLVELTDELVDGITSEARLAHLLEESHSVPRRMASYRQMERPQEAGYSFEILPSCVDFMNKVFQANDTTAPCTRLKKRRDVQMYHLSSHCSQIAWSPHPYRSD